MVPYLDLSTPEKFDISRENQKQPELVEIHKTRKHIFLYSPLLMRIYMLTLAEYDLLNSLNNDIKPEFLSSGLVVANPEHLYPQQPIDSEIVLSLTSDCNLNCKYCYAGAGERSQYLDFDVIEKLIDWCKSQDLNIKAITFHGEGEPTLAFDVLKDTVRYAKSKLPGVKFVIQSNGILSDEVLTWIDKNIDHTGISCDGPPKIHDFHRLLKDDRPTSNSVEKSISEIDKKKLDVLVTVTNHSVEYQDEIVEYLNQLGVKSVRMLLMYETPRAIEHNLKTPDKDVFVKYLFKAIELSEQYKMGLRCLTIPLAKRYSFCNITKPTIYLMTDGNLSACTFDIIGEVDRNVFIYGRYDFNNKKFELDENKISKLHDRNIKNLPGCNDCFLKFNCAGGCAAISYSKCNDLNQHDTDFCELLKDITKRYLIYKINKHFVRIKPYLERGRDGFYFSTFYNRFKLKETKNNNKLFDNPSIRIELSKTDLKKLYREIIKHRQKRGYKSTLFLLDFALSETGLSLGNGRKIEHFLESLVGSGIFFKVITPLPRCLFGTKYNDIVNKFEIPKGCNECLKLFTLSDSRVIFCNGKNGRKLSDYENRDEIYNDVDDNILSLKKCQSCVYRTRKQCYGLCGETLLS